MINPNAEYRQNRIRPHIVHRSESATFGPGGAFLTYTPCFAGQAKATAYGRGRLLTSG